MINYFFAEVIVPISLDKTLTYIVSETEFHFLKKGMRVAVPIKNKIYTGLVSDLHQEKPLLYEPKEISQILDETPIVTSHQLNHWFWIADYYMCNIGDVYRTALPSAFLLESETIISQKPEIFVDSHQLTDEEFLIYEALQHQSNLRIQDIMSILNKKNILPIIQSMIDKNILVLEDEMQEEYKPKMVRYVKLNEEFNNDNGLQILLAKLQKSDKQKEIVLAYFQLIAQEKKPVTVKKLVEFSGVSNASVKSLITKEIFEEYFLQTDRVDFSNKTINKILELSPVQETTFSAIEQQLQEKTVCLLHGVTASGKTEIYTKLIDTYINQGKQVLFLVPEIALTTQLVGRLQQYFGNKIAVFHSKYNNNERVEVWQNVLKQSDKAQIVIGARSSLFLPFQNLGLIIIDEEHEQTFKQQEPSPRYHARDVSIVLANLFKAKVLLGSATPSVESFYNAKINKYGLVTITERYANVSMPTIELVDLKDKYHRKLMTGHFSDDLLNEITDRLSLGEQVILFQNRRGYSPVIECVTCGHVPQCIQCDVSLTYHKIKNQLRCHYCGYAIPCPTECLSCASPNLTTKGFGTEQIQHELQTIFPSAKVGRMDQDTTRGKFGYEKILDSFKNQEIEILVGTQMLAKGLDFENVTLVGIMNADNMLYHPDYRAYERCFQMLTQVSGRSGRSEKQGKVIIQTYTPKHNTIQQVLYNDYTAMFEEQLYQRNVYKYSPFYKIIKITLKQKDYEKLREGALWFYNVLVQNLKMPILGPEEPPINRIRNEYIRTILIKIPQNTSIYHTKTTLRKVIKSFDAVPQYKAIKLILNIDF